MRTKGPLAMAGSACLSDAILTAYHTGQLAGDDWQSAADHLRGCPTCLARIERLPSTDPILAALRHAPPDPTPDDDAFRRALAKLTDLAPRGQAEHVGPGSTLRDYQILELLGEGGMGAVFKARHTRLDRIVAVKVLRRGRRDPASIARFDREIRAAGKFRHEHIVQATDAGEANGVPFLVMEFVEGQDIAHLVGERGPLRLCDACEIARQAALGLAHAHAAGMIHRDVKPSNLMLTPAGVVKVLDLGLALLQNANDVPPPDQGSDPSTWDSEATLTGSQQAIGTRHYMAPEQWESPHAVDARADVYGLGCTLLFLLAGHTPRTDAERIFPAPLTALGKKLVAKDPAERFASAADVAVALKPFARGGDLPALAARRPPRKPWRPHLWVALALLLAVVATGVWLSRRDPPTRGQLPLTPQQAQSLQKQWADQVHMPIVTTNSLGMAMVLIPPGDLPLHGGGTTPIAGPFRIGACEVTVGQFRAFVKAKNYRTTPEAGNGGMTMHTGTPAPDPNANWQKPGVPTSDEHPVTQVAYPDAAAFCEWLSAQENAKYRLPTLKEWRWACKAGSHAAYYFGDDAKLLPEYAWVRENAPKGPQPVGQLKPNNWGLYDMLGNVREWLSDIGGPPSRKFRMAAGGSTTSAAPQHVVDAYGGFEDWVASSGLGFRVVREIR